MKKVLIFIVIALAVIALFSGVGNSSGSSYDDVMAGYDWGDHAYYNRNSHQVEWTPWK